MLPEHQRIMTGCGLVMLVTIVGFAMFQHWSTQRAIESSMTNESSNDDGPEGIKLPPPPPKPVLTPRQQYDQLMSDRKYAEAAMLCKKMMDSADATEQKWGRELLPEPLKSQCWQAQEKHDNTAYRKAMNELDALARTSVSGESPAWRSRLTSELDNIHRQFEDGLAREMQAVFNSGDAAKIDAACEAAWNDPLGQLPAKEYAEFKMKQWREAKKSGRADEAAEALRKAVLRSICDLNSLNYWGYYLTPVEETLRESMKWAEVMSAARQALASGDFALAASYSSVARRIQADANSPKDLPATAFLDSMTVLHEALLGLARQAVDGKLRWFQLDPKQNQVELLLDRPKLFAAEIKRMDKSSRSPAEKYKISSDAWALYLDYLLVKLERLKKSNDWIGAYSLCGSTLKGVSEQYLNFRRMYLNEDFMAGLPPEIRAKVEKAGAKPEDRYTALYQLITSRLYTPDFPGREQWIENEITIVARQGMDALAEGQLERAFDFFRDLLRNHPAHPATIKARDALVARIKQAQQGNDFGQIYNLASFFVLERGRSELTQEVKDTVAAGLTAAADSFKTSSPMKRVFMLSLLADLLEGDPRGAMAFGEAQTLGFQAVAKLPMDQARAANRILPSNLAGLSVVAIENATEYCLLVFFDGPEQFFVRFNPYGNGSVVLKDGTYTNAVIVTSDTVRPYRGQHVLMSQYQMSRYEIVTEVNGKREDKPRNIYSTGSFRLLRVPPNSGNFQIEPETGMVKAK